MSIIYFLIPITLLLMGLALWAFIWAVNNHQFDDLESPQHKILFEENTKRNDNGSKIR